MKTAIILSTAAILATSSIANTDMQTQIDTLTKEIEKIKKDNSRTKKTLSSVKKATSNDNIKFGLDFRNAVDVLNYEGTDSEGNDISASNNSLLTSRLYMTMAAAPMKGLTFRGKLGIYSTWGAHLHVNDPAFKDWAATAKAADTVMRVKEAFFVYSNTIGEQPISFSIGRRPSSDGFLANYRENKKNPGSPLAHITNMEVNAAMVKLSWDRFIEGAYTKFVYGRAHSGEMQDIYGDIPLARTPYALTDTDAEDKSVDFFVMPGDAYNDGQYQIMYQWAHIFNTKGKALNGAGSEDDVNKAASGSADLFSIGLKVEGIGDEINDFLDETTFFISGAYTNYSADEGYSLLGSESGGSKDGSSVWTGIVIPDMITESGKFGFEYNYGSQYWTPITWAEDTAMGSKIAVRGSAYEAYWNFDLFGVKYLPSQIRYTYAQHDYTPNINCAGWVAPQEVDIQSSDLRVSVSYRY